MDTLFSEPLLSFFLSIKDKYHLGIDDYCLLNRSLASSFCLNTEADLLRLCKLLWLKNIKEEQQFELEFQTFYTKALAAFQDRVKDNPSFDNNGDKDKSDSEKPSASENTDKPNSDNNPPQKKGGTVYLDKGLKGEGTQPTNEEEARDFLEKGFDFQFGEKNFYPLNERINKLNWQKFSKKSLSNNNQEIDINACINHFAQKGFLHELNYQSDFINVQKLIILVDNSNSMTTFEYLAEQIIRIINSENIETKVFYFDNLPYFLEAKEENGFIKWGNFLRKYGNSHHLLIISEIGAVKGNYNSDRITKTKALINNAKQKFASIVWLNPMPERRWKHTTAEKIAEIVPMCEADQKGISTAINILSHQLKLKK